MAKTKTVIVSSSEGNVSVTGLKELKARMEKISKFTEDEVEQALIDGALLVNRDYKLNVSNAGLVDTGMWLNSITIKPEDFGTDHPSVQVGSTIQDPPYPKMHEFGTSHFKPTPTLGPAYEMNKSKILKKLAQAFKKGVGL